MKKVYAFDFDGTLTTRDTLLQFIVYARGQWALIKGLAKYAHLLILMKLGYYPNWKVKQKVFAYFFKSMPLEHFNDLCKDFACSSRQLLRPAGIKAIEAAQQQGADVVIISASFDNWVQYFFPHVTVLGTQVEVKDEKLTGRFLTKNCYGQEKVNRLVTLYPHRQDYHLIAFGDSRGDKELLAFADESYFKPFKA